METTPQDYLGTTPLQRQIISEVCRSLGLLGANSGLMACVASWGDTLPQDEILSMLKVWNDQAETNGWIKSQAVIA